MTDIATTCARINDSDDINAAFAAVMALPADERRAVLKYGRTKPTHKAMWQWLAAAVDWPTTVEHPLPTPEARASAMFKLEDGYTLGHRTAGAVAIRHDRKHISAKLWAAIEAANGGSHDLLNALHNELQREGL